MLKVAGESQRNRFTRLSKADGALFLGIPTLQRHQVPDGAFEQPCVAFRCSTLSSTRGNHAAQGSGAHPQ